MPITQGDLSLKRAAVNNDVAAQNGGRLTDTTVNASLFPDITGAERAAGKTRYRKIFFKNEAGTGTLPLKYSDPNLVLLSGKIYMENFSCAGDYYLIKAGTSSDVQSGVVDSGWGATGYLEANVLANDTDLTVATEINGSGGELFLEGGTVLISDYLSGSGNREFITIDVGGVSWAGNVATLTFTGTPLQNNYNRNALAADRTADIFTANTIGYTGDSMTTNALVGLRVHIKSGTGSGQWRRIISNTVTTITTEYAWSTTPDGTSVYEVIKSIVAQCVPCGNIAASYDNVVVTSASGTFDDTEISLFPVGTRDDTWTLLFSSATAFSITGAHYNTIPGTYSTLTTTRPVNGASYYFEIDPAAWGGTFQAGDTVVFDTFSSSAAAWIKEVVPASTSPHLANSIDIGCCGDTV